MRDSRRTSLLLTAAVALILVHFFPNLAGPAAWLALCAGLVWIAVVVSRLLKYYRSKSKQATQQAADDLDYKSYKSDLDALRALYDPNDEWDDTTNYPLAYRESLAALHQRHRAMLERRFGPS